MHILPDLDALEKRHSVNDGLAIVGVHSAKFDNEKVPGNILSAVQRYNIKHPVINDHKTEMWDKNEIQCWPTLLILSPHDHRPLIHLPGEGHRDFLLAFVDATLEYFDSLGQVQHTPIVSLQTESLPSTPLLFPGKISLSPSGRKLAISDTGHHRILITNSSGVVEVGNIPYSFHHLMYVIPVTFIKANCNVIQ